MNSEEKSSLVPKGPSRLPVPGLRLKRPANDENESPKVDRKRARLPLAPAKQGGAVVAAPILPKLPPAAPGLRNSRQPGGRRRSSTRTRGAVAGVAGASATAGSRRAVAAAVPKPAAVAAGRGEKKRAPWDLKGQVSDLRAKVGAYKEKVQGLAGENETTKKQLQQLEDELKQATALNQQLSEQNRALALELQGCEAQLKGSLQKLEEQVELEQRLQAAVRSQRQAIQELEASGQEARQAKEDLAARLETREAELRLVRESLARQAQEKEALAARNTQLEQKLHESEMERRSLHNAVQELKGNIRVFCRVRPLLTSEKEAQKRGMSHLRFPPDDSKSLVLSRAEESHVGRERKEDIVYEFNFDQVFPPSSSQEEVFEEISLLVQSALDGYHVCIFAYGQTGSGKTYTMEGPDCHDPSTAGMIPRAVQQIFKKAQEMEAKGWKYQFTANFLEIYNETLRDLLVSRPERGSELEIRRVSQCTEELHVPNLCYIPVASEQEVLKLLQRAKAQRSVAKTNLNERSSRSHSLFQLRIEGQNANRELHTSSVLSLVDLAGSERLDKSLSTGDRLKETQAINSSLSNLGQVITALSNKEAHVPYRNSKLTYLLQNSLGGNSKMLMFVNISPLEENFAESLNSLRFARKVNECVIGTASNRK